MGFFASVTADNSLTDERMNCKMWRQYAAQALTVFGLSTFLVTGLQSSVISGDRQIFGENPTAIERYFGQYWTRLTLTHAEGDRHVTYTYSPGKIRSFFNNAEDLRLSVRFTNDQAVSVRVHQDGAGFNIPVERFEPSANSIDIFDDVFESIFGYRPPSISPVDRQILQPELLQGTLHTVTYCMDEGIAMSYEWISTEDYIWFISFFQEPMCV
ncbi:hypothetical protein Lepto7376_2315 [[Leptolyngbya] sp. PCC 7376]|uniref:hypothetical protein n=1 Tax=[Leptolyngbya] sp. PCC 7376 TaxID=111781 RepID=UPI00029F1467|nr:hypothetical protein [[Leptolyngbya] sp. PCC 7376]AFY38602.1 hypothetical protein Lepto7376_2315 [[Leptolyngbya] sp. PCC 7376]